MTKCIHRNVYRNTAKPRTSAPTAVEATPIYLASTACAPSSYAAGDVALPPLEPVSVAVLPPVLLPAVGVASSPYSEVMDAMTLLKVGSAKTAEDT